MSQILRVPREEMSLRQRTSEALRAAILDGVFSPGQKLLERELCENLGVSRSLLRESLQHLQAEGLITIVPHKGPEVTNITRDEVKDIYEVRASLESMAGRGFALNASDAQVAALRDKLREMQSVEAAGAASGTPILRLKNQFYDILIEGCGNVVVGQMLRQLNNRVTVLRRISMAQPGRLVDTFKELDAIVTAIEKRDGEAAARCCLEHVRRAGDNVLRGIPVAITAKSSAP